MKSLTSLTCIYPVILKNETTIVFVFCFCFCFFCRRGDDYHTARVCFLKTNFVVMGKSGRDRGKNSQSIACPEDPFPSVGNSQICLCFTIDYRLSPPPISVYNVHLFVIALHKRESKDLFLCHIIFFCLNCSS